MLTIIKKTLGVRLPADHWIFKEKNKRKVVEEALKQYKETGRTLNEIQQSVSEIKSILATGTFQNTVPEKPKEDARFEENIFAEF